MRYLLDGLETDRLRFRLLEEDDFRSWAALFADDRTKAFFGMDTIATADHCCRIWFDRVFSRYANDEGGMNVLVDKHTGVLVGQCGLLVQDIDNQTELEIGYSILPTYRGQGYAVEAARAARDFAFEEKYARSLISIIHIDNAFSQRVALGNDMQIDKQIIYKQLPVYIYRIDRQEWESL